MKRARKKRKTKGKKSIKDILRESGALKEESIKDILRESGALKGEKIKAKRMRIPDNPEERRKMFMRISETSENILNKLVVYEKGNSKLTPHINRLREERVTYYQDISKERILEQLRLNMEWSERVKKHKEQMAKK